MYCADDGPARFTIEINRLRSGVWKLCARTRLAVLRYSTLRCRLSSEDEGIADLLLDMFLAADGRPTIDKIRGRLEWEYSRRFGPD